MGFPSAGGGSISTDPLDDNLSFTTGKTFTLPVLDPIDPPGAPSVAAGAAGNPNGDYRYAITFVTTFGETPAGTQTGTVTLTSQKGELTSIPLGPTGTTDRKIYRTSNGGSDLLFVAALGDNVTTVYTDDTADGSLGALAPTVNTALVPSQLTAGTVGYLTDAGAVVVPGDIRVLFGTQIMAGAGIGGISGAPQAFAALNLDQAYPQLVAQTGNNALNSYLSFEPGNISLAASRYLAADPTNPAAELAVYDDVSFAFARFKVSTDAAGLRTAQIQSDQFVFTTLPTSTDPATGGALFTASGAEVGALVAAGAKYVLVSKGAP